MEHPERWRDADGNPKECVLWFVARVGMDFEFLVFFSGREIAADWRCWFDRLNDWDIVLKWLDVEVLFLNSALSDEILLMEFQSIHLFQYKNTKFLINCLQKPSLLNYLLPQKKSLFPWVSICQTAQHRSHPPIFSFSNGIEIAKQTAKTYIHTRLAECPSQRNRWFAYTGNAACQIWDFAVSLEHSTHTWRRPAAMPEYKLANLRIFFSGELRQQWRQMIAGSVAGLSSCRLVVCRKISSPRTWG